jgi:catechol 2,3-dioxygenase-like lactoylglutathione lyase family enzyme
MMTQIDHIIMKVNDWEVTRAFYRDVVGAEIVDHPDGNFALRFGHQQLNLHGPGVNTHLTATVPVAPGNTDICFVWEGPSEGAAEHLRKHGIDIIAGPVARYGARGRGVSHYFRDPDGSLLEFISYQRPPTQEEIDAGDTVQVPFSAPAATTDSPEGQS